MFCILHCVMYVIYVMISVVEVFIDYSVYVFVFMWRGQSPIILGKDSGRVMSNLQQ